MTRAKRKRKKSKRSGLKRGQKRIPAEVTFRETYLRLGLIAPDTEFNRRAAAYAKETARYFRDLGRSKACWEASGAEAGLGHPRADRSQAGSAAFPRPVPRPTAPSVPHQTR